MKTMYFQDPNAMIFGLPGFNTFRIGNKWASLRLGERIHAEVIPPGGQEADAAPHSILRVDGVVVGAARVLLHGHAPYNHA